MKRVRLIFFILASVNSLLYARLEQPITYILNEIDSAEEVSYSNSLRIVEMAKALDSARLNEMNLRLEIEAIKMEGFRKDSLKRTQQRQRIDSLRRITSGVPVTIESDTLYYIYARRGGVAPQSRAQAVEDAVTSLGKKFSVYPDSIYIESTDITTELMYDNRVIASFTDQDALWENTSRDELAKMRREVIVKKLHELQKEHGLMQFMKRIAMFVFIIFVQILLIWGTSWVYRRGKNYINSLKESKLKPISFHDYEILDTHRQVRVLLLFWRLVRYVSILILLIITIPVLFSIFPQTEALAYKIFSYIWNPVRKIFSSIIDYIPNLFTIIIIWLAIKYLVKVFYYFAKEIEADKLKIAGFYPDWAQPSYQIVRFLLYAFMIAMIYPYLPGSEDGVFQGVSVFVGLIISLGSTSVISNVMAGMIITYMRPFKIGDRIKLNDTIGNVMEKTPFVTRIKTPKNEIVTIPNSFVLSSHTINYSSSARKYGLIIHSEISIGFDVPWELAHELLIEAALKIANVEKEPAPFVLETSLEDFYPVYQINAYIKDADKSAQIYSELHRNIQELAAEAGIELLSPHYYAGRDGSELTIPKKYSRKKVKEE